MKKANYIAGALLLVFSAVIFFSCLSSARGNQEVTEIVLFPILLSVLIAAGSIAMILFTRLGPDLGKIPFHGKVKDVTIAVVILLLAYPLLQYFGFIPSTMVLCFGMLRLLGNSTKVSVIAAVLISLSVYTVFHFGLSVSLPKGLIMRKLL